MPWSHPTTHTAWLARGMDVRCDGDFTLPPNQAMLVEQAWQELTRTQAVLYDGEILHVRSIDLEEGVLHCQRARYRHVAARRAGIETGVRALGVSGLAHTGDSVLVAQRSNVVHLYPGRWELAPSGTAHPDERQPRSAPVGEDAPLCFDPVDCLLSELREETGIERKPASIAPMLLAYDAVTMSYDACYAMRFDAAVAPSPGEEYSELTWSPLDDVLALRDSLIPVSAIMIQQFVDGREATAVNS